VLCDKPLGATIDDAGALAAPATEPAAFVMIGYQWSFSSAIQALKRDLSQVATAPAAPGHALRLAARHGLLPAELLAGRLRDAASGAWVLDSPANNAMAHFLHNALFLLGPEVHLSAVPASVTSELARAYRSRAPTRPRAAS